MTTPLAAKIARDYGTPAAVIDMDRVERNIARIQPACDAAGLAGRPLSVVVECDTGRKRAGVETPAEAVALAREIAASKGLTFAGFMLYPTETGWSEAQRFFDEALAGVRAQGLDAVMVSTGGTPNLKNLGKL